jgi:hypothetical protein
MKRRLLGTLEVWETDNTQCISGLHRHAGSNKYEIELCPKTQIGGPGVKSLERTDQKDILAHELGHFVANILGLPELEKDSVRIARNVALGFEPEARPMVPVETEAWQVADSIIPEASKSPAHEQGMSTYERHDKHLNELLSEATPEERFLLSDKVAFLGKDVTR